MNQTSFLHALSETSTAGILILGFLALSSIFAWTLWLQKQSYLKVLKEQDRRFLEQFFKGGSFSEIQSLARNLHHSPLAAAFLASLDVWTRAGGLDTQSPSGFEERMLNLKRALDRVSLEWQENAEQNLHYLASIASLAPFIGLSGTVIGIITAFQKIGASGSANLAVVAPGIAEALITTAIGILVAIPASFSYNQLLAQLVVLETRMEAFKLDMLMLMQRQGRQFEANFS